MSTIKQYHYLKIKRNVLCEELAFVGNEVNTDFYISTVSRSGTISHSNKAKQTNHRFNSIRDSSASRVGLELGLNFKAIGEDLIDQHKSKKGLETVTFPSWK